MIFFDKKKFLCRGHGDSPGAWMPSANNATTEILGELNITHISARMGCPRNFRLIDVLRNSAMGGFYIKRLKHVSFIRSLVILAWLKLSPWVMRVIAAILVYKNLGPWRKIVRQRDYVRSSNSNIYKLADPERIETPVPIFFPTDCGNYFPSPHDAYVFPEIYVAEIAGAAVFGGTNFIQAGGKYICHDLYDFDRDFTSEELNTRALINVSRMQLRFMSRDQSPARLPVAACFTDACARNYAHWMTEVLSRIAVFCADPRFVGVPLIVDEGLHPNIMQSLLFVVGTEREIIILAPWRAVEVDKLYLTSVAGYMPFGRRSEKLSGHSQGRFSAYAFGLIRDRLMEAAVQHVQGTWPEKISIRRISGTRKVTNVDEIDRFMAEHGYTIVEPEKLSLLQQVRLFHGAKYIAGSSGAALANMLFAPQDARLFVLMSKQHNNIYWYWQSMACAAGNKICYILGEIDGSKRDGIHADFKVDIGDLSAALASIGN